ncbi:DUF1206 domain-containing protein [Salipiger sp. PrR002]|uniref:DUF1206 domain-containing protein n=1 Tax=Salipiger sp. PrR002 TaxID=2706489 RepID=UPI0013BC81E8|nr:DUF1206 domain-containing protein [Salipiger sp. PrR002]NDW00826.1 DUF1206 domain-containing protein [Salipiger sp. PrR002]NDW58053.1 DUF1206 domain-containing protein [Salipiger sp. PrR004]
MSLAESLSIKPDSRRAKRLEDVNPEDFAWAIPIMRAGYSGRGLVYLVVAGVSLWSILHGGQAEGTSEAMQSLQGGWGTAVIVLIALGMLAYAVWRLVDCIWDLEAYGRGAKGLIARAGMLVTGGAHLGIGILAATLLIGRSGGSSGKQMLDSVLQNPAGQIAVGIAGVLTVAAGGFYLMKAVKEKYRNHLKANHFTTHWNGALKAGLAAQGVVIGIIGMLICYAALHANASEAGGLGSAFDWLQGQVYGRVLVGLLCLGLLGFALFCFVNAAYRIIPKAADRGIESLGASLRAKAENATS